MVDLAPEGCISLRDFYDAFTSWKWATDDLIGELNLERRIAAIPDERKALARAALSAVIDASLREAVSLFASGEFQAFILLPGSSERRVISARTWAKAFFAERFFLSPDVEAGHGSEFEAARGRTLFVSQVATSAYFKAKSATRAETPSSLALRDLVIGLVMDGVIRPGVAEEFRRRWHLRAMEERPPPERYDPAKIVVWTLPMVLSWMVFRSLYRVREAMDEFRANWWIWIPYRRRLPLRGGEAWFEVEGAELQTRERLSIMKLAMIEATEREDEHSGIQMSVKEARDALWARLAEGKLVATGLSTDGAVVQIPSYEWPYLALEADDQMMDRVVIANGQHRKAYDKVTVKQSDVVAIWQRRPEPPPPPMMEFLLDDPSWTFLEAATWVGSRGRDLPSQQMADEDLEDKGATALFKALFPQRGLVATGLNHRRLREPIPAEYWEMATMDPHKFRERHYVSFIDDVLHEYGGQLTPAGEDGPKWFGIRLDRDAMLAAFPDIAADVLPNAPVSRNAAAPRSRKLSVTRDAIVAIYPNGFPKGLSDKERLEAVNRWLTDHGHSEVSLSTLSRAAKSI